MPPRLGLLIVGHPDYQNGVGEEFAIQAAEALRRAGVDVVFDKKSHTDAPTAGEKARDLLKQDVDGVLLFLATWVECPTAIAAVREFEHLPFALWGFNMFEREGRRESTGSFVAACVLKGALDRMGYRYKLLIGMPSEPQVAERAACFCRAAGPREASFFPRRPRQEN